MGKGEKCWWLPCWWLPCWWLPCWWLPCWWLPCWWLPCWWLPCWWLPCWWLPCWWLPCWWLTSFSPSPTMFSGFFFPFRTKKVIIVLLRTTDCLTHSHTMTPFDALRNKPFENTVGKGEIARNEQFLLFPLCFLAIWITFCHFRQI